MQKPGLKSLFHVSATRGGSDYAMIRVVRLESSGEILEANEGEMILGHETYQFPHTSD